MKIEIKKFKDVNRAPYNPRVELKAGMSEYEKLKKSVETFGHVLPMVYNVRSGTLVGGHQTMTVLEDLGRTEAEMSIVDLNEVEEKALNIGLNKISGEWNNDKLIGILNELIEIPDFDIDLTGFTLDEIGEIDLQLPTPEAEEDDFDADKAIGEIDEPITKRGDVILLGSHRLMCGDSTKAEDVKELMGGKKADLIFTDPPYGVSYSDKNEFLNAIDKGNRIQAPIINDNKTVPEMSDMWVEAFTLMNEHSKKGASYYVCSPQGGELMMMMMSLQKAGWQLKHSIIWVKNNHVLGRSDYHYKHEPILYGWNDGTHHFYGGSSKFSVWNFDKPHKNDLHPTMKPILLICEGIQNSSKQGEIVLDLFLGSGSTLIAAEQTNRICYGMELSEKYCDVCVSRWEEYTKKKAVRL